MAIDMTAFLESVHPPLEFDHEGKIYSCPPPDVETGKRLTALYVFGEAVGRSMGGEDLPADLLESRRDALEKLGVAELREVAPLSLGQAAYDKMVADGMPAPYIETLGQYALLHWVLGPEGAKRWMDTLAESRGADPKAPAPSPSKSGPSTGSGSRKGTSKGSRSTGTTASRRAQPAASSVTPPESDGPTSSATGDSSSPTSPPSME